MVVENAVVAGPELTEFDFNFVAHYASAETQLLIPAAGASQIETAGRRRGLADRANQKSAIA
jgi:hypothetical protein